MYLDSCNSKKHSVTHRLTPRANFLHEKPLRSIYYEDRIRNGKSDLTKYIIGKLPWKGRNDIAYSYMLHVEELFVEDSVPPYYERNDLGPKAIDSSQPQLCVSQPPVNGHGCVPGSTVNTKPLMSVGVIKEINMLLQKVDNLSRCVPSTEDRLSRVAGIFPPGHGPSPDFHKETSEFEASVLDNLRNAVSFVRKNFIYLGMKEDLVCGHLENGAFEIEKEMNKQEFFASVGAGVDLGGASKKAAVGQADSEAEEDSRLADEEANQEIDQSEDDLLHVDDDCFDKQIPAPVTPPLDDSGDDDAGEVFADNDSVNDDFIPSSQLGEQKFDEGYDDISPQHIVTDVCLKDGVTAGSIDPVVDSGENLDTLYEVGRCSSVKPSIEEADQTIVEESVDHVVVDAGIASSEPVVFCEAEHLVKDALVHPVIQEAAPDSAPCARDEQVNDASITKDSSANADPDCHNGGLSESFEVVCTPSEGIGKDL